MGKTKPNYEQAIIRAIKFVSIFYDLKPHGREITRHQVDAAMNCTPTVSRNWLNAGSRVLPLRREIHSGLERSDIQCPFYYTWKTID